MNRKLVAVAASAITAVYVAGYVHTQAADSLFSSSSDAAPLAASPPEPAPSVMVSKPAGETANPPTAEATRQVTPVVITDQAVEQFADVHQVSWDVARAQMEATASVTPESALASAPTAPPGSSRVAFAATPDTSTAVPTTAAASPRIASTAAARLRPTLTPTSVARPVPVAPTRTPAPAPSAGWKDGTYSGVGTSRRGDVQVSLAVQSGRIISVNITRATTQYPTRLIAGLPGQVVSHQSAQVDSVSGATFSSLAFRAAVQQALQQAHS